MILELMRSIRLAVELWSALHDVRRPPYLDEVRERIGPTPVLVVFYAQRHEVPVTEAFALASHESNFRDWRVSSAGCIGTLQIQPRYYCREPGSCDTAADRIERGLETWKRRRSQNSTLRDAARAYARGASAARSNPAVGSDYADGYLRLERHLRLRLTRSPRAPRVPPMSRPYLPPVSVLALARAHVAPLTAIARTFTAHDLPVRGL